MEFQLLIHTVGSIISAIFSFGLAVFTYFNNPKKTANIMLSLTTAAAGVFYISHAVGINIADPLASRSVFMWNLSIIFISVFSAHTVLAVIGIQHKRKIILGSIYAVSLILLVFYITHPDAFLAPSEPKLFFVGLLLGYSPGFLPVLPIFNVFVINPNWGLFFVFFFAIPFVYAVVNYELLDIRLVAKKAFVYGLIVAGVSAVIAFLNLGSSFMENAYPNLPAWILSVAVAIVASGIGTFVWKKMRETDILKYEFITIVTHKFRTPLTRIKWAAE